MTDKDGGLRSLERQHMPTAQWTTIETGLVAHGVPDMEYCWAGGRQGWLENKFTDAWAVKVQPGQVAWIHRRARLGGRVHIAVRRRASAGPRRAEVDELWLLHGRDVETLALRGLRAVEQPLGVWTRGPSRWDWAAVEEILRS